jgi:hypothetical protein
VFPGSTPRDRVELGPMVGNVARWRRGRTISTPPLIPARLGVPCSLSSTLCGRSGGLDRGWVMIESEPCVGSPTPPVGEGAPKELGSSHPRGRLIEVRGHGVLDAGTRSGVGCPRWAEPAPGLPGEVLHTLSAYPIGSACDRTWHAGSVVFSII